MIGREPGVQKQVSWYRNKATAARRWQLGAQIRLQIVSIVKVSLQRDPNHEPTLQNITFAYIKKGDQAKAKEFLERLEKVNPSNDQIFDFKREIENIQSK